MRAARAWLRAAWGLLDESLNPDELLDHLLIHCWADEFLSQHLEVLRYRLQMFQAGRSDPE